MLRTTYKSVCKYACHKWYACVYVFVGAYAIYIYYVYYYLKLIFFTFIICINNNIYIVKIVPTFNNTNKHVNYC